MIWSALDFYVSFCESKQLAAWEPVQLDFAYRFKIPKYLFSEVCTRSNGFFWCWDVDDEVDQPPRHSECQLRRSLTRC